MKSEDCGNKMTSHSESESCTLPEDAREVVYGRLCREQGKPYDEAVLDGLAEIMRDSKAKRAARPKRTRTMASGFLYLGQFIDHDLTRDGSPVPDAKRNVDEIWNHRTPRLDLDHLYGKEPASVRCLYDDEGHLLLGETLASPGWLKGFDDLRRAEDGTAIVIDPRSDENLIIAQMHVLWSKVHNRFIDLLPKQPELGKGVPGTTLFERARRLVTWHYQWIVWNDFLPRIVRKSVLDEVKRKKPLKLYSAHYTSANYPVELPVEFTMAAFRFGHSMVQENYRLNESKFALIQTILEMTKPGGGIKTKLPAEFVIDWRFFFTDTMINFTQNVDTYITEALYDLERGAVRVFRSPPSSVLKDEASSRGKFSLPKLTLKRGSNAGLPSGEQFARFFKLPLLSPAKIFARPEDEAFFQKEGIKGRTPLWYYLLREAAVEGKPEPATPTDPTPIQKLGTIGSRIVAEVISQVLSADVNSIFNAGRKWQPPFIRPDPVKPSFRLKSMAAIVGWIHPTL